MANKMTTEQRDDLARLEKIVDDGRKTFVAVGNALMEIRDRKLYRDTCATFEAYVQIRFEWSRAHAYRHIEAAKTVELIGSTSPMGDIGPTSERVVRPLTELPEEQRAPAYVEATEIAKAEGKPKPTHRHTTAAVRARRKDKPRALEPEAGGSAGTDTLPDGGVPVGGSPAPNLPGDEPGGHREEAGSEVLGGSSQGEADPRPASPADPVPELGTAAVGEGAPSVPADVGVLLGFSQRQLEAAELAALTDDDERRLITLGRWCQQIVARRRVLTQTGAAA